MWWSAPEEPEADPASSVLGDRGHVDHLLRLLLNRRPGEDLPVAEVLASVQMARHDTAVLIVPRLLQLTAIDCFGDPPASPGTGR
jgi:hypothetical protein